MSSVRVRVIAFALLFALLCSFALEEVAAQWGFSPWGGYGGYGMGYGYRPYGYRPWGYGRRWNSWYGK